MNIQSPLGLDQSIRPDEALRIGLNSAAALYWRHWDDEYVVFDEASGRTHLLDALTACVLLCVEDGAVNTEELVSQICEHMSLSSESVWAALPAILEQLTAVSLVETVPG